MENKKYEAIRRVGTLNYVKDQNALKTFYPETLEQEVKDTDEAIEIFREFLDEEELEVFEKSFKEGNDGWCGFIQRKNGTHFAIWGNSRIESTPMNIIVIELK